MRRAAGPLIPNEIDARCLRSDRNWPHVLATHLHTALTDVTCSEATTADLSGRQFGVVALDVVRVHQFVGVGRVAAARSPLRQIPHHDDLGARGAPVDLRQRGGHLRRGGVDAGGELVDAADGGPRSTT